LPARFWASFLKSGEVVVEYRRVPRCWFLVHLYRAIETFPASTLSANYNKMKKWLGSSLNNFRYDPPIKTTGTINARFFFYQNLSLGQRADQSRAVRLKKLATSITFYIFSENNLHECTFRRHTTQANSKFFARIARLTPKGEAESAQIETYSNVFGIFCSGELLWRLFRPSILGFPL